MRPNSAKLAIIPGILRVYLGKPGYTWKIPGILPISPIFVRFCLRSRGKSYHNLIVLAVECLIVLGGYTSKWPSLAGEDDSEEDEPVEIQLSDVTMHPKGTPAPASSVEARVFEERVDLSNNMTCRQMIGVGVRNVVLARGELDRLEGPGYAARRTELRRKAKEAARTRDRQAAASQDEAEENDATEEEVTRERPTRVGRPRGGMKVAARSGERLRKEIRRGRLPRVGDG